MKLISTKDFYPLCVIALVEMAASLPTQRLRLLLVKAVASLAYRLSMTKRRLSEQHVRQAFSPPPSEREIAGIVKSSFYGFWLDTFSLPPGSKPLLPLQDVGVRGLAHLGQALEQGSGVILWESSYLGCRLLAKKLLQRQGFAIDQVHARYHMGGFYDRPAFDSWVRRRVIRPYFENREKPFVKEIVYLAGIDSLAVLKTLGRRLNQNGIICISADVGRGHKLVSLRFLGQSVSFPTGMVSLARLTGATILPIFCFQENDRRLVLTIEAPIRLDAQLQRETALSRAVSEYAALLEKYIRRHPDQYRSWHSLTVPARPGHPA